MKFDNCALLVCSCDNYEDSWYPFFKLLKNYWPDCDMPIILNTETKKYEFDGLDINCFQLYKQNDRIPYGQRLIDHLMRIETDYIFVLIDDFFIREPVDSDEIALYLDYIKNHSDVAAISFDSVKDDLNIDDGELEKCLLRPRYGEYIVNLQAGIWNKEKLMSYIRKNDSPWDVEIQGTFRSYETKDKFYTLKDLSLSPINYGKKKGLTWGIVRGKWVYEDVKPLFDKHDIDVDLEQRGLFDIDNFEDITIAHKRPLKQRINSLGFKLWFKMNMFRISKVVKLILKLKYNNDYIEYMRNKTYKKEK
ncbi:hypothetical protein [Eubacterium sp.]|uniref:hypothetical protein n=1 Tax=Eubacterium sp. TaxID=142586 RepID=UPI0025C450BA|nr:hypothetical protein [Eubacterium sp.]MCI7801522.1 hypothetical protein [Eubacterium sp.]